MKILVIGRGRCGTKTVSLALKEMGFDVGHEIMGRNGSVHNEWAHDINGRPPLSDFDYVWHVVREPKANIASMHTFAWIDGPAPQMPMTRHCWGDLTSRCAISWYEWNLECEKTLQEAAALGKHTWRFRIEDNWVDKMFGMLNYTGGIPEVSKNSNTRKMNSNHPGYMGWSQILDGLTLPNRVRILDMTERYGYATPETEAKLDVEAVAEDEEAVSNLGCA